MKKSLLAAVVCVFSVLGMQAQGVQFKIVTTVESIVPGGLGRSRIIENGQEVNYSDFTTTRTKDGKEKTSKNRGDVKIEELKESTLVNFYSMVGINFQNIASNDAMMTSMLNAHSKEGWELTHIASGGESDAGKGDGNGIFITRYYFKKAAK